ncbi:hypothetical protein OPKNFCMD_0734 [Methylobacterium crusticola]|uniref:Uncharacterized protein n=1 Tax=Methylobacterium crusticola TaxID=1697972 RepID=A0ABQ4QT03_9HYPH|nr:hypothetical protein OPKNFCMD_0734 [Methylobacterium crusticola]
MDREIDAMPHPVALLYRDLLACAEGKGTALVTRGTF